jgi:hypothetical protein
MEPNAGKATLLELLKSAKTLERIVDALWPALERLATASAASGAELHDKFVQQGAFTMAFGGLETFFGGALFFVLSLFRARALRRAARRVPSRLAAEHLAGLPTRRGPTLTRSATALARVHNVSCRTRGPRRPAVAQHQ